MWPFNSSSKPTERSGETAPESAVQSAPTQAPAEQERATDYLRSHSFQPVVGGAAPESEAPTAAGLLRHSALDPTALHPLANISGGDLEYLDIEEAQPNSLEGARTALPSRGWTDDLCYGTGTTYLSGLGIGGLVGLREGLRRPLGVQSPTMRLRMNAVLNTVTRRGTFLGNSAGVLAMTYNLFDAAIDASRGKHDIYGSLASGALTGALYRCTSGLRSMAVASTLMMAAAAAWTGSKRFIMSL